MKAKIIDTTVKKEFKPFKLEFEIETVQEARLFYHIVNHADLFRTLYEGNYNQNASYWDNNYSTDVVKTICQEDFAYDEIAKRIKDAGYEV
jgi:hypothetical protein